MNKIKELRYKKTRQQLRYVQLELEETQLIYEDCVDKFNIEFNSDWIDDSGKVSDIKFDVEGREFRLVGGLEGKKYKDSVEKIENGKVVKVDEWKEVNSNYMRIVESSDVDVLSRMNDLS